MLPYDNAIEQLHGESSILAAVCDCPPGFSNESARIGAHDWPEVNARDEPVCGGDGEVPFTTQVNYQCPDGFVFETPDLLLYGVESNVLTLTCERYAAWSPTAQPKCIRKKKEVHHVDIN